MSSREVSSTATHRLCLFSVSMCAFVFLRDLLWCARVSCTLRCLHSWFVKRTDAEFVVNDRYEMLSVVLLSAGEKLCMHCVLWQTSKGADIIR